MIKLAEFYISHMTETIKMTDIFTKVTGYFAGANTTTLSDSAVTASLSGMAKSDLLKIGNHMTGILADRKVNLEVNQIVVVGTQSSGKSTILNRIINMPILPTGKQMVTRTPLNLQLTNSPDLNHAEFGEYIDGNWRLDLKVDLNATNYPSLIEDEISRQTLVRAGQGMGISHRAIILKIFSPNVPTLSLTDLPGLTQVACLDKGQPKDIKEQIRRMVGEYIKSDRAIILLVMASRNDLEVDLGFELAKEYDPFGQRTIGVLTKPDLMGTGCDVSDYLLNRNVSSSLQLKYGYYVVKNPTGTPPSSALASTAKFMKSTVSAVSAMASNEHTVSETHMKSHSNSNSNSNSSGSGDAEYITESTYFSSHPVYSQSVLQETGRIGIPNLVANLVTILTDQIRATLPQVLSEVNQVELDLLEQLRSLGTLTADTEADATAVIYTLVGNFCRQYHSALSQRGARLNYGRQLKDIFCKCRKTLMNKKYDFNEQLISEALTNCDGNHMLSLPSIEVLEYCLTTPHRHATGGSSGNENTAQTQPESPLCSFLPCATQCLDQVQSLLGGLIDELTNSRETQIGRFSHLSSTIKREILVGIMQKHHSLCQKQLQNLIRIEENYIWTDDATFQSELQKLYQTIKPNQLDHKSLSGLIGNYYDCVRRNLMDRVPKEIMWHYVTMVEREITETIFDRVTNPKLLGLKTDSTSETSKNYLINLLEESAQVSDRRKRIREQLSQVTALKTLIHTQVI
jgi:GTP-binding protein EngB required for normal cell division